MWVFSEFRNNEQLNTNETKIVLENEKRISNELSETETECEEILLEFEEIDDNVTPMKDRKVELEIRITTAIGKEREMLPSLQNKTLELRNWELIEENLMKGKLSKAEINVKQNESKCQVDFELKESSQQQKILVFENK